MGGLAAVEALELGACPRLQLFPHRYNPLEVQRLRNGCCPLHPRSG